MDNERSIQHAQAKYSRAKVSSALPRAPRRAHWSRTARAQRGEHTSQRKSFAAPALLSLPVPPCSQHSAMREMVYYTREAREKFVQVCLDNPDLSKEDPELIDMMATTISLNRSAHIIMTRLGERNNPYIWHQIPGLSPDYSPSPIASPERPRQWEQDEAERHRHLPPLADDEVLELQVERPARVPRFGPGGYGLNPSSSEDEGEEEEVVVEAEVVEVVAEPRRSVRLLNVPIVNYTR